MFQSATFNSRAKTCKILPALTLDDRLRQVPGFSLFRRSSSRTANPTTQGVSLRGLGANGASRALVLQDGIPLNDPFGGWVYWDRVPAESIADIEIAQEGASEPIRQRRPRRRSAIRFAADRTWLVFRWRLPTGIRTLPICRSGRAARKADGNPCLAAKYLTPTDMF